MSDQILWNNLKLICEKLSADDQDTLLDYARWLAGDSRLAGGPLDGYRIPDQYKDSGERLSVKCNGKVAIYERDHFLKFRFCRMAPIGGEGYWCDFDADDIQGGAE